MTLKHTETCPLFCGTAAIEKETRTKQVKRFALYLVHLTKTRYIILFAFVILSPSFVNVNNKNSLYSVFYPNLSLVFGLCILPNFFWSRFPLHTSLCKRFHIFHAFSKDNKLLNSQNLWNRFHNACSYSTVFHWFFSKIPEILQEYFLFSHFNRFRAISFSCASWNNINIPLSLLLNHVYLLIK